MGKNNTNYKFEYENLLNVFPCALYVIRDSVIIDCNTAAVKMFGYEAKEEILGLKPYELSPEKQSDGKFSVIEGEKIIQNALSSKEIVFEWKHKKKNGDTFLAEVKIFNKNGTLYAVMCHINEIRQSKPELKKSNYFVNSSFLNKTQTDNIINLNYEGELVKEEGLIRYKDCKLLDEAYNFCNDVLCRKVYKEQLELFGKILENNSEGVVITDTNGNIEWVNNAFKELTGFSLTEIKGKNMNILRSGIQSPGFYKKMWDKLVNDGTWSGRIWNKTKKGEIYSEWLTINSIKDGTNNTIRYVGIFEDLSEKNKIDRKIKDLQQKDILTGLYNRNYFLELVDTYIRNNTSNKQFAIIFINIEDFKEIIISLGHQIGDELLIELSRRLQFLMDNNYILSRYNGNEFAILFGSSNSKNDIKNIVEILLNKIKEPFKIGSTILNLTANIGISVFPDNGKDAETLIRHAETAMYKARGQLENKICFYSKEMSKEIEERFLLANLLIGAISNREFTINYQPIFNIKNSMNIVGLEALLRWNNPILGKVAPDKFIPLAEKTGQIIYIGEWVLEQVCRQINVWQHTYYKIPPIAVNISVKQLEQVEFPKKVIEILKKYGINPNNIELEITESVYSGNLVIIVKNLKKLKKHGFKISMDDFGTGFSSLRQLELFELDKLKIDKTFINGMLNISKKQNLVKSIVEMAKSLNLAVVAEGIETNDQLYYLRQLGCQLGQGYLLGKPLSSGEIETFFECNKLNYSLKEQIST